MNQPETVEISQVTRFRGAPLPQLVRLVRHANNGWTGYFDLDSEVELTDGRRVAFRRSVAVRATQQIGRKAKQ